MKRIILMRHGKSSWEYGISDKDRPLKERGINDAHLIAQNFKKEGIKVDFAFSSLANRALHTAIIFLSSTGHDFEKFRITEDLYDFSGDSVKSYVKAFDDDHQTVAIFGHNHAFTGLANLWGDQYVDNVPTSGLVLIEFAERDWKSISKGKTRVTLFPKHFK